MAKLAKAYVNITSGSSILADLSNGAPSYWAAEAEAIAAEVTAELAAEEAAYAELARMLLNILNLDGEGMTNAEAIDAASAALGVDVREFDLS